VLPPLVSLPPDRLAGRLAEEHVFAELCAALMLSFAAENEARMRAMISAHGNVQRTRESLLSAFHRLRQEEITVEIVELAAGRAARPRHHGPAGIR
jgi:F-type H+-transporting ATPase subunit gamma